MSASASLRVDTGVVTRELPQRPDLLALAALRPQRYPCLLQSVAIGDRVAWDVMPAFPQNSVRIDRTGDVVDAQGCAVGNDFLAALDAQWRAQPATPDAAAAALPFRRGWALFLACETVSNVGAALRAGVTPGEVIRAVFPGGTITGCPKVRCMQLIAELEHSGRGACTGALGLDA